MSAANGDGVIRIGRKGKMKFAIGDSAPFEIDVVLIYNRWLEIDRSFRDDKDVILPDKNLEHNEAAFQFLTTVLSDASVKVENLTLAEVFEFLKLVTDEVAKLRDFFVPAISKEPSSPEKTELTFTT